MLEKKKKKLKEFNELNNKNRPYSFFIGHQIPVAFLGLLYNVGISFSKQHHLATTGLKCTCCLQRKQSGPPGGQWRWYTPAQKRAAQKSDNPLHVPETRLEQRPLRRGALLVMEDSPVTHQCNRALLNDRLHHCPSSKTAARSVVRHRLQTASPTSDQLKRCKRKHFVLSRGRLHFSDGLCFVCLLISPI